MLLWSDDPIIAEALAQPDTDYLGDLARRNIARHAALPFRFPTKPTDFDRMLAGAATVAADVLSAPYGGARLPELTNEQAYAIGFGMVGRAAGEEPVIDGAACDQWIAG